MPHIAPGGSRHWIKSWHIGWNRLHASRVCTGKISATSRLVFSPWINQNLLIRLVCTTCGRYYVALSTLHYFHQRDHWFQNMVCYFPIISNWIWKSFIKGNWLALETSVGKDDSIKNIHTVGMAFINYLINYAFN